MLQGTAVRQNGSQAVSCNVQQYGSTAVRLSVAMYSSTAVQLSVLVDCSIRIGACWYATVPTIRDWFLRSGMKLLGQDIGLSVIE
jgi:hypothetical protein